MNTKKEEEDNHIKTLTTLENMYSLYEATACIVPHKDWVIVAFQSYKEINVHIFETTESSEHTSNFERKYNLFIDSEESFTDQGEAIKWAFEKIGG